jgi:hypothetical protein
MSHLEQLAVNYDEAAVGSYVLPALSIDGNGAPVSTLDEARAAQARWRLTFADGLFGELPPPPDRLDVTRLPLPEPRSERLALNITVGDRELAVDAALWLPADTDDPVPLIVALDFTGPFGTLTSSAFPMDPKAIIARPGWLGGGQGPMSGVMRGTSPHRIPVDLLTRAGFAVITSCYGSWVPDEAAASRQHGLWPLLDLDAHDAPPGVVCLWSWALGRLIDAAVTLSEIDASNISVAGHSRLGKAALWAAVNDPRIGALFLNESGCGGAALSRRNFGESFAHNRAGFPHWLLSEERARAAGLDAVDQHQLLALMAPRKLYVASAAEDLWCDPRGEYLGLRGAAPLWGVFGHAVDLPSAEEVYAPGNRVKAGPLGWHLREGGHELTPYDWTRFLDFLKGEAS